MQKSKVGCAAFYKGFSLAGHLWNALVHFNASALSSLQISYKSSEKASVPEMRRMRHVPHHLPQK